MRAALAEREGPLRYPIGVTFVACCASPATGTRARLSARTTASPISRMGHLGEGRLPGSLADRHDAHQHSAYAGRFQRDEEQAAEAVSHGRASARYSMTWSARPSTDGGMVSP